MGLTIRTATIDDLDALRELTQERDGTIYAPEHVRTAFVDLDPEFGRTWLAEIDGEPAGTTSMVWRDLYRLGRAGYWTNLYVRPKFRARMVYPLLVRKMQASIEADGMVCCYCVVRRPRVLEGHLKLKFEAAAEYDVLARPLRPARLLRRATSDDAPTMRKRAIAVLAAAARPIDALAVAGTRVLARFGADVHEASVAGVLTLATAHAPGAVQWSEPRLAMRLRPAIDGEPYRLRSVGHDAAVVWRLARRGGVQAAPILELAGTDARATRRLLHAACGDAARDGADVALWLDGAAEQRSSLRRTGFIRTRERYTLVVWPPRSLDASRLRFSFLDHDAF